MRSPKKLDEERDITGPLKRLSNDFKLFCETERHRAGQIEWYYYPTLQVIIPSAEAAHVHDPYKNLHSICLTRFPIRKNDDHLIAHEIMHAVIAEEGNNLKIFEKNALYRQFKAYMSSMLEDPFVEFILYKKYKFDIVNSCLYWIESMRSDWTEPKDKLTQMSNACNLANQMMRWKLIEENGALNEEDSIGTWSNFLKDYCTTYSNVYSFANGFFEIMDTCGLDTLDQRRSSFLKISKKYGLDIYLNLDNQLNR